MRDDEEAATARMEDWHGETPSVDSDLDSVDVAGDESFPASDPPSRTPIIRIGCPRQAP